jgi:hypothetical protein
MRFAALIVMILALGGVTACGATPHVVVPVDSALKQWEPKDVPEDEAPTTEATPPEEGKQPEVR